MNFSFRQAIMDAGMTPPDHIRAGCWERFPGLEKKTSNRAGFCFLFDDLRGGVFGDFSTGLKEVWHLGEEMSLAEQATARKQIKEAQKRYKKELNQTHKKAAKIANDRWNKAVSIISHPYLEKKKVLPLGIRQEGKNLIIPMYVNDVIASIQTITPEGEKRFQKHGQIAAGYYPIGEPKKTLYICEGYATGATIHQVTDKAVAVAFNADNLSSVAKSLRQKFPNVEIVICADDDQWTEDNPGITKAREAAIAVNAKIVHPEFSDTSTKPTDFNDLFLLEGIEIVKSQLEDSLSNQKTTPKSNHRIDDEFNNNTSTSNEPYQNVCHFYDSGKRKSRVTVLIEIGEYLEKFHDTNGETYVVIIIKGHREVWPMKSKVFRDWLSHQYFQLAESGTDRSSINDALSTLAAIAKFDCEERHVYRRVAGDNKTIYIDLCDEFWRVIEVSALGWQILDKSPVMFIRSKGMTALPVPSEQGCIEQLWNFLNIEEKHRPLILAYMVAAFRPQGPYPILVLLGEQGTAKSTFAKILRMLIDPSSVPLRPPPKDERDFLIGATNNWMISLDNLSGMRPWLSDALCRMATGGGFATRELYTDISEILIDLQRPTIVNGIDDVATRPDFAERSMLLHLPPIQSQDRFTEKKLMEAFQEVCATILGGIMNLLSSAICNVDSVSLKSQPRMADFAEWAVAAKIDGFLDAYNQNQNAVTVTGVQASPVGSAVMYLMEDKVEWNGTMAELHKELEKFIEEDLKNSKAWPKSPTWLSNYLRRLGSSLRKLGIDVTLPEQAKDHQVHIKTILQSGKIVDIVELPQENEANEQNRQFSEDVKNNAVIAMGQKGQKSSIVENTQYIEEF